MLDASDPLAHPIGHGGAGSGSTIAVYARAGKAADVWTASPVSEHAAREVFRLLR